MYMCISELLNVLINVQIFFIFQIQKKNYKNVVYIPYHVKIKISK